MTDLAQIFEEAIKRQEAIRFNKKLASATFLAKELDGINKVCEGQKAVWNGFKITRRRVDELDNIYVSRA